MKKIVLLFFTCVIIYSQSIDASMTIYKNGFALIKQPVSWSIDKESSEIEYGTLPEGIRESTPYLNLSNGKVLNQKFNKNLFSENKGVVAEGFLQDRNYLRAVKILAKHDENYMPPEVKEALGDK